MRVLFLALFFTLGAPWLRAQAEWPRPNWDKVENVGCRGDGKPILSSIGQYQVRLFPVSTSKVQNSGCRGYLVDPLGKQTFLLEDWAISVHQGTGDDIFSDGHPSLVLEGYSGGAHCCYTYRIISLTTPPVALPAIRNETPFYFFKDSASGQYRVMTSDGAFDYFDGLCHACAPFPRVVLRVDHEGLHDVSTDFVGQYDSEIALARAKIAGGDISKFLITDFDDARSVVLEIVFSYLYSGREGQAWQTLDEMWPAGDRDRIRKLILHTKAKGLLSKLAKTKPLSAACPRILCSPPASIMRGVSDCHSPSP